MLELETFMEESMWYIMQMCIIPQEKFLAHCLIEPTLKQNCMKRLLCFKTSAKNNHSHRAEHWSDVCRPPWLVFR